jgi:hypothetical protein
VQVDAAGIGASQQPQELDHLLDFLGEIFECVRDIIQVGAVSAQVKELLKTVDLSTFVV